MRAVALNQCQVAAHTELNTGHASCRTEQVLANEIVICTVKVRAPKNDLSPFRVALLRL
jgi:hypothetical protein